MRGWSIACAALLFGVVLALAILLAVLSPARAQEVSGCLSKDEPQVPGAADQRADCLADLSTKGLVDEVYTTRED
jgi:hypothetical protein